MTDKELEILRVAATRAPGEPVCAALDDDDLEEGGAFDVDRSAPADGALPPRYRFTLGFRHSRLGVGDLIALPPRHGRHTVRIVEARDNEEAQTIRMAAIHVATATIH